MVVGGLHACVKELWSFKVEAEEDLRGVRGAAGKRADDTVAALRARVRG